MIEQQHRVLTFAALDDLAFAAAKGRLSGRSPVPFQARALGPVLELLHITGGATAAASIDLAWVNVGSTEGLAEALRGPRQRWVCPKSRSMGVFRGERSAKCTDWTAFLMDAKRAGLEAGLVQNWAAGMVGALGEIHDNIGEHSASPGTGYAAFRATPGVFEFVVGDRGLGLLSTLRQAPEYAQLADHGEALRLALSEGASRFGFQEGRGYGFRPLFTGLANRQGALRFRTGNSALVIEGASPSLVRAQTSEKPTIEGFFASVTCSVAVPQ